MRRDNSEAIKDLQYELQRQSSAAKKKWWEAYMRGAIPFRGIGIPQIRPILAEWRERHAIAARTPQKQLDLVLQLFAEPIAEDKLTAVLYLQYYLRHDRPWRTAIRAYEKVYKAGHIAEWSTCDWFCVRVIGPTIQDNGEECARAIAGWNSAKNLWQARSSVVAFVYITSEERYRPLILESSVVLVQRDERFAKTAVGWVLREIWKHDPDAVRSFVSAHVRDFSIEAARNALKYASPDERARSIEELKGGRPRDRDSELHVYRIRTAPA